MGLKKRIKELSEETQELNRQLESLEFIKKNNFTSLFDVADEIENKHNDLHGVIQAVINNQIEKNPKQMESKERETWFSITLTKMNKINELLDILISEIKIIKN